MPVLHQGTSNPDIYIAESNKAIRPFRQSRDLAQMVKSPQNDPSWVAPQQGGGGLSSLGSKLPFRFCNSMVRLEFMEGVIFCILEQTNWCVHQLMDHQQPVFVSQQLSLAATSVS
jgi:hypothetical protein